MAFIGSGVAVKVGNCVVGSGVTTEMGDCLVYCGVTVEVGSRLVVEMSLLPKKKDETAQQEQMTHQIKKSRAWIWRKRGEVIDRDDAACRSGCLPT
jgi:hypothetical protein